MNWRSANSGMTNTVALIFVLFAFVFPGRAQSQDFDPSLSKDRPLLELDLGKFGYDTSSRTKRLPKFVDFTDSNRIALGWLTFDDPTVAEKTGPLTAKPAHLHVLVLDARTGQKQGLQEWSTPSTPVRFLGVRDGKFLTCTGNVLRLFSPSFEVIREESLPNGRACLNLFWSEAWGLSPSRRYLLLSSPLGQGYQNTLFDVETFTAVANWIEKRLTNDISDHWLVAYCGQRGEICIRGTDQSWQSFQPDGLDKQMKDFKLKSPLFVNDGTLVIEAGNEMAVVEVDGKVLFQVGLPKKRSFGRPVRSSGGERFAIMENRLRGLTNETLDMYAFPSNDRVVVYSIPDRRAIYAIKVKGVSPWTPWVIHRNQLALSTDGNLLALVADGILKVYRLPDRTSR
jgi:outer membrane protein assembly factor BamB